MISDLESYTTSRYKIPSSANIIFKFNKFKRKIVFKRITEYVVCPDHKDRLGQFGRVWIKFLVVVGF